MIEGDAMDQFMSEISIIVRLMRLDAERAMSAHELGFPEQMVLMVLSSGETLSQTAIAKSLDIDKGAIARTTAKLTEKGLVTRIENPGNRRENMVAITPAAASVLEEMRGNLESFMERAFAGFSHEERVEIQRGLNKIVRNLTQERIE